MSATADDVAATTAAETVVPDGNQPEPKSADPAPAVTDPDESRKVLDPVQKRIDELTRKRYDSDRARADAESRARDLERQLNEARQPKPEVVKAKKLSDFGYDEDAYRDYLFTEVRTEAARVSREEFNREASTTSRQQRQQEFTARETDFAKDLGDYIEVTRAPSLRVTDEMAQVLEDSDVGPQVLYHLGKNPKLALQIARLPALQQAREIGRLEMQLEKPVTQKVSKAPAPPPKVDGTGDSTPITPDSAASDKLSAEEWAKRRNKQLSRKN